MSDFICFSINSLELPVISAFDTAAIKPPYVHFHRHYHEFILYYILSGELFLNEGDKSYALKKNDFLLLDPSRSHYGEKTSACQFYYIHFSLPSLTETSLHDGHITKLFEQAQFARLKADEHALLMPGDSSTLYIPKYHTFLAPDRITQVHLLLNKALKAFSSHEFHHKTEASCLLYELLILLARDFSFKQLYDNKTTHSAISQTIPLLLNFLNQSYSQNISSSLIESMYNCNFDYLNRQFKKMTGQTIFAYLNSLRIEKARQLLATGFYTIADVAVRTGFHDVYYFSKVFKKYTGLTPGKYSRF